VATPIGNARDITLRALDLLAAVDVVACEDTRTTGRLLGLHGISATLTAYHDHNAARVRPALLERLKAGQAIALVSDAGTPLISDPGYRLVVEARAAGITVTTAPGPSAPIAALTVSGLPTDRFFFAGFLPSKRAARRRALEALSAIDGALLMFESARRLANSLADMADVLGPREAAVVRELTKLHEEVRRATLDVLAAQYGDAGAPKGEIVIVVAPPGADADRLDDGVVDELLRAALATDSLRDAAARVALATGLPRRRLYNRALELAGEDP
jgi:16S rRNA (cytidine1402-2'-O)-methyltransferase